MPEKTGKLFIKNMVCQRCVMTVENVLRELAIPFRDVKLGEVEYQGTLSADERSKVETALEKFGFELIATRVNKVIDDIKKAVREYIDMSLDSQQLNLSAFITERIPNAYSYLSDLFSSVEGKTIEQYFIQQRIEKVKELIVYDQLPLTEISYRTGFSSVHHLSAQFKKLTGLTPSHFKKIGAGKRKSLDAI